MEKMEYENLTRKETIIFSIYGDFIGACIFLLIVNYGCLIKNNLLIFLDLTFSILNIFMVFFVLKQIIYLTKKFKSDSLIKKYNNRSNNRFLNIFFSFVFILFLIIVGLFLLVFFKEKSIYIFTAYSLGMSFILYSLIIFYFLVKNKIIKNYPSINSN